MGELYNQFKLGVKVFRQRSKLARDISVRDEEIGKYVENFSKLRNYSFEEGVKKQFAGLAGAFVGNYTSFCPFQISLDLFDEEVEQYCKLEGIDLSCFD